MGSQAVQEKLWGQKPEDWANIQEATGIAGYEYVLSYLNPKPGTALLDIGCGSGLFSSTAHARGLAVTGIDGTGALIEQAKKRVSDVTFLTGEMEELPFGNDLFDVVCGFNSFQYAANVKNAITEARRVLKNKGRFAAMIWGNKEDCEAATYLKAVGSLLPPPPPGAAGPFALTENGLLEQITEETGLKIIHQADIPGIWDYPDTDTALRGLISAGPAARAVEHSGFEKVYSTILNAVQPYVQSNGHVVYQNKFRIVIAEK